MRGVVYLAVLSLLFTLEVPTQIASAQGTSSSFDEITASFNEAFAGFESDSRSTIDSVESEYDQLQKSIEEEYSQFKREVCDTWGEESATVGDRYRWVEYGDDKLSRSIVDFESGEVEVELLLSDEELADEELVGAKIDAAVARLLASKGSSVEYESKYIPRQEMSESPIMDEIYDIRSRNIRREPSPRASQQSAESSQASQSATEIEREVIRLREELAALTPQSEPEAQPEREPEVAVEPVVEQAPAPASAPEQPTAEEVRTVKKVQTTSGERNVVTVKSNLKVGYLSDLAKRYESIVMKSAERFNLSPTLIFAVMETESYFNPTATSHIPAFGLMQIVPKYAGRDVYKHLYGEDRILSKEYLYQADKNVEIGAGYLHLLSTRYFAGVTDPRSRELCMIAAYNTGAGNVSRAMVGHTNVYKSISKINSMSYSNLYSYMRKNLPYEETRNYIERVTTKQTKYVAK